MKKSHGRNDEHPEKRDNLTLKEGFSLFCFPPGERKVENNTLRDLRASAVKEGWGFYYD